MHDGASGEQRHVSLFPDRFHGEVRMSMPSAPDPGSRTVGGLPVTGTEAALVSRGKRPAWVPVVLGLVAFAWILFLALLAFTTVPSWRLNLLQLEQATVVVVVHATDDSPPQAHEYTSTGPRSSSPRESPESRTWKLYSGSFEIDSTLKGELSGPITVAGLPTRFHKGDTAILPLRKIDGEWRVVFGFANWGEIAPEMQRSFTILQPLVYPATNESTAAAKRALEEINAAANPAPGK